MDFDVFIAVGGFAFTVITAVAGWVWNLSSKLGEQEERSKSASIAASNASARLVILEQELSEHREHVALKYVNRDDLKEITDAINRLGDRLDNLLIRMMMPKQ